MINIINNAYVEFCKLDIFHEVSLLLLTRMSKAGFEIDSRMDDKDIIIAYFGILNRRIQARPRKIYSANYKIPPVFEKAHRVFLKRVRRGRDISSYQSKKIDDALYNDLMLNGFNIQHFHLSTERDNANPRFTKRVDPLLFSYVTDKEFYSLGFYSHGAWSRKEFLDILNKKWPDLLKSYTLRGEGTLSHHYSDEERLELWKKKINVLDKVGEKILAPLGMGNTTNGSSLKVVIKVNDLYKHCQKLSVQLRLDISQILKDEELSQPSYVRLSDEGEKIYIKIIGQNKRCELLSISSL